MTLKLYRNYFFEAEKESGGILNIEPPFTLQLDITRNLLNSANVCQLRFYNLSERNRNELYYNQSDYTGGNFRQIQLRAGYGQSSQNLKTIFLGNITQAWSVREGPNFITQIECMDGGNSYVNANIDMTFKAGTPIRTVISDIMETLKDSSNLTVGGIGDFSGTLSRDNAYKGNPNAILFELTGGGFFIDNGKAYAMKTSEYVPEASTDSIPVINVDYNSGLLNTPILERTQARFEMLFEPSLNPGRKIELNSITFPKLNGHYKVYMVKHRGIISPSVSGKLITVADFYKNNLLEPISSIEN